MSNVTQTSQQVDKALDEVAEIIKELDNLPEIGTFYYRYSAIVLLNQTL